MSAHMERLLARMGQESGGLTPHRAPSKRILEVNPDHPLIQSLEAMRARDPGDARLEKACRLLYDQAVITEGSKVKDPLAFAQRLNELLMRELGQ